MIRTANICPCPLGFRRHPFRTRTGIFYRASGTHSVGYIGSSIRKKDSLLLSMRLHIQYLRSLEDSERGPESLLDVPAELGTASSIRTQSDNDNVAQLQSLPRSFKDIWRSPVCAGNMLGWNRCLDGELQNGLRWCFHRSRLHASGIATRQCIGWRLASASMP